MIRNDLANGNIHGNINKKNTTRFKNSITAPQTFMSCI